MNFAYPRAAAGRRASAREAEREALEKVRAVYAELARRPLTRSCTSSTGCCQFHITGRVPQLTRGEARLAARAVRAVGRKAMPERLDGACPLLRPDGRCLIYEDRPFGCRTHFCAAAGGPVSRGEVVDLIRELEAIDHQLGGSGPRALQAAVAMELAQMT